MAAKFDECVQRVLDAISQASAEQVHRGMTWYSTTHQIAISMANGHGLRASAGIISALSPLKTWEHNVEIAGDALDGYVHGHVGEALSKVRAILFGTDPTDVLPNALKTGHFFRLIVNPFDETSVAIDSHAYEVAVGDDHGKRMAHLERPKVYEFFANVYREAAHQLGILPSQAQAIAWLVDRES